MRTIHALAMTLTLGAAGAAAADTATFVTILRGQPVGREVVTRSAGEGGPILTSHAAIELPGGISLTFDQRATLSPDGLRIVAYDLSAVGAGRNAHITAEPTPGGWKLAAGAPDSSVPPIAKDLPVQGPSSLVDNNLASHLDLFCRGLRLAPGEKLSTTAVVPQVLMAITGTTTRTGEGAGTLDGKPTETLRYRLEMASVMLELDCRKVDGALMEARVPMQQVTYRLEGYMSDAAPAEAADPRERETSVGSAELKLPAVLTLPKAEGTVPIVVMLSGSGPNDRDETIGPNKPFRDLARGLADRGIASLRFDKAAHLGKDASSLDEEYVTDALSAIAVARAQPGVDGSRVVLLGHSLGALGALTTAVKTQDLRGLVLMAGPVRAVDVMLLDQVSHQMKLTGADAAEIETQQHQIEQAFARYRDPSSVLPPPFMGASARYWKDLLSRDTVALVGASSLPILVLQGEKDIQVRLDVDYGVLRAKVGDVGGRVTYRSFPGLNHLFMPIEGESTGGEYAIAGHVAPEVIEAVASWVLAR